MSVLAMNDACTAAEREVRAEEWARDWLTLTTWSSNRGISALVTLLLIIPDVLISIPRAIFASVPILNIPYLILGQIFYMILLGPVLGTSWVWREVKVARPLVRLPLILIGIPVALLGTIYASVWLMGGPEEGPNKYYKKAVFESWPLTVGFMTRVFDYYPYDL